MHNGATFLINATYKSPHFTAFSPYQSLKIIMNYRNRETGKQDMCETETGDKKRTRQCLSSYKQQALLESGCFHILKL